MSSMDVGGKEMLELKGVKIFRTLAISAASQISQPAHLAQMREDSRGLVLLPFQLDNTDGQSDT